MLASCQPPKEEFGEFIDTTCTITDSTASGLKVAPSLAFQSYEGIGIFLAPKSSVLANLKGKEISYKVTFRQPQDLLGAMP